MIRVTDVSKTFTLHNQGGADLEVISKASLHVDAGECVALAGVSGSGKSTLLRMIYGNYVSASGSIMVGDVNVATADPRSLIRLRRDAIGYVSQFLRVVPRVPTIDVVAAPALPAGMGTDQAYGRAADLLTRLRIPENLWSLSPLTFSGGEQQRVNIARGFARHYPALLVDEPTASLDGDNRATVLDLITEAKARGVAILGIFHDAAARAQVCDREVDVSEFKAA